MGWRDRVRGRLLDRRVVAVFALVGFVPVALTILSFREFVDLPDGALSGLEVAFRLTVYAPVDGIRTVLLGPLGAEALLGVPVVGQLLTVATVLCFYYLVSVVLVRGSTLLRERIDRTGGGP